MSKKIDQQQVKQVAKLARLDLDDSEVAKFSTELSSILEYIEKLGELDTDGVEPLAHCLPVNNVFREDKPRPSLSNEQALKNAPERVDKFFMVPKILDDNSNS
ncbi:Glutamyl-tRNA(Gln) amidotransferase subunit C [Anaerohalosphaera lusitana]|uniref:Aspartyl/glutamyl-tRNA(Asn/Gln) amidotransferase subunit C n=1 Tax=Anaerohalosphaera lusitana TaxID=1936003 RepID=A0A1U9NLW6_9BACT|nr:Asp-tRNA(Asn)/Glu-tRNA(Gln) amidotransferase subunit GatC [Anaerohalosphaera lusitana]AQT68942.1 Glutamyl-tRNA(Gln) amidotransferase subunit C [Anaerohalosphaera lusitana]